MARPLPLLEGELPPSSADVLCHVRTWVEHCTDSSPWNWVDYETYNVIRGWYADESKKAIIESIVKARVKLPPPQNYKALLLAQFFADATLASMADDLRAIADTKEPLYGHIAETLHGQAIAHKTAAEEADAAWKWNTWRGMYGRNCSGGWLPPLKQEPGWGMWGIVPVTPQQWWTAPAAPEEKK